MRHLLCVSHYLFPSCQWVLNLVQLLALYCMFVTVFIMRLHIHGKLQPCVVVCCCGCCCCFCCCVPLYHILQVASCTLAQRGKLLVAAACEILIALHRGAVRPSVEGEYSTILTYDV